MKIIICLFLLICVASAKTPMIGDQVRVLMSNGSYSGEVESFEFGLLCLNCTEYHDVKENNYINGLYSPNGWPVCLGVNQIVSISWS